MSVDPQENTSPNFDLVPPQAKEAEQAVLGAMMLDKDAIADVVEVLRGVDFYHPHHERIFEAIIALYSKNAPADAVTVADELATDDQLDKIGGPNYLYELLSMPQAAASAGYYARIVRDQAVLRRLVHAGMRITQMGYSRDGQEVEELVNAAQAEVYAVSEQRHSQDYRKIGESINDVMLEIENAQNQESGPIGVPTGLIDLDELTHGLHAGQMIIIAARPGLGKSTLALDICRSASVKHKMASAFFSLEMGRNELTMRALSAESGVPLETMRKGGMSDKQWEELAKASSPLADAPLFIDDSPNLTLMEIRAKARRMRQSDDLRLIVVDYLQLMTSGRKVESRQQEVSEFSRALKLLAKELEIPVIAVAQLNRGPEQRTDKKPQMSDLRESGSLEQDADVVILLHRQETDDPALKGQSDLIVAKHRNGPTRTVTVAFQGDRSRFANLGQASAYAGGDRGFNSGEVQTYGESEPAY